MDLKSGAIEAGLTPAVASVDETMSDLRQAGEINPTSCSYKTLS